MKIFFLFLVLVYGGTNIIVPTELNTTSGDIHVPLGFDEPQSYRAKVSLFNHINVRGSSGQPIRRRMILGTNYTLEDIEINNTPIWSTDIGIGPNSPLLISGGPIALIWNSGNTSPDLVFRSTEDFFLDHCVPGSFVSIPFVARYGEAIDIQGMVSIHGESRRAVGGYGNQQMERLLIHTHYEGRLISVERTMYYEGRLISVERNMYREILSRVRNLTGVVTTIGPSHTLFSNCENISAGPSIELTIRSGQEDEIAGANTFVIHPEDYFRLIPGTNTCELLIGITDRPIIYLDPLLWRYVNFRIYRGQNTFGGWIQFCDSV